MSIAALVAAAGTSSRMGMPKALLPMRRGTSPVVAPSTFVSRIVEVFVASRLYPVIVTVPDDDEQAQRIARAVAHLPVVVTRNHHPALGLTGSVMTALENAPDADGLVLTPVDCPFLDVALVESLVRSLTVAHAAVPVVGEERGHPVVFSRATFELLCAAGNSGGPRAVLDALDTDVLEVPWSDPRVCEDVDTVDDYERLFGWRPSPKRQG